MLLQRLAEYGAREDSGVPPRYKATAVKYIVYLAEDGAYLNTVELSDGGITGRKNRGKEMIVPNISRTSGVKANLLVDNAEYALGIPRDAAKTADAARRHQSFVEQVRRCATATDTAEVRAVLAFLDSLDRERLDLPDEFDPSANLTFTVTRRGAGDVLLVSLEPVRRYWAAQKDEGAGGEDFECLVCGTRGAVERTLEFKVRGIPYGQPMGTALISANKEAFTSYGLKQSENSPICGRCGEAFSKALNKLIAEPQTHYRAGPVQHVFWTREPVGIDWGGFFREPDSPQVRALLDSWRTARRGATELDATPFYSTALSASGGRAAVRDWLDTTVGEAQRRLVRYFALQELVDWNGQPGPPLPVARLANATLRIPRGATDEPSPNVPRVLLRLALAGGHLPQNLLHEAVRRNRAEQRVLRDRAVLIKMTLHSWRDEEEGEGWMVQLDTRNTDEGYLCGRLLAVLESIQYAALGEVNANIVDRFYGTASSAPLTVFPRLLKGARPHLAKLRRERRATCLALEARLEVVVGPLKPDENFPTLLTLEQQGMFALGFYHQRAEDSRARLARRAGRDGGADQDDQ